MAPTENTGHEPVDVHIDHLGLAVTEKLADIAGDLHDFSPFFDKINVDCSVFRVKDIDLGLFKETFLNLFLAAHLLKFSSFGPVEFNISVKYQIEEVQSSRLTVDRS